ncbi:hypothetical protein BDFB_009291, partial [Asbolus verrucosus]
CKPHALDTIIRATHIFEKRCLPEFFVASVEAQKCPGNVPCRWRVTCKYIDPNRQYEGGEYAKRLVRRFDAVKPERTNIMKPAIGLITVVNDGPCYVIHYGVICECVIDEVPYFGSNDDGPIFHISGIFSY